MPWQFQGACYPTPLAANQAAASASSGVVSGGSVVVVTAVTESTLTYEFTDPATSVVSTVIAPLTPQPCNLLTAEDAYDIGWLLIGAWVATYAVRFLSALIDRHLNGVPHDA